MSSNKSSWYMKGGKPYSNQGRKPIWFRKNAKAPSTSGSTSSNKSKLLKYVVETKPTAYTGWRLYFLEEAYTEGSTTHRKIKHCEEFIQRHLRLFSFEKIEENQAFILDLTVVKKDDSFNSVWPNFFDELTTSAEHILSCLGLAMHQTIIEAREKLESTDQAIEQCELRKIHARITNHEPILHLKNLKVNYYGKLVSVRGTVIRVSDVKLICRWMTFECGSCRGKQVLKQPDGVYTVPSRCDTRGCKAQTRFRPVLSLPHTRTDNWQMLKLQELIGTDQCEGGRIPRIVECELTDDLVNSCVPGDDVTITGIIKVRNTEESSTRNKQASIFLLYIDAVSVVNNKNQSQASHGASGIEFNLVDYYAIQKIHAEPALFKLLVHSLCPAIYGHEMIKAGLILSLFGGTASGPGTRADPHILMVGDPGLGKSQMLQACSNVAPRGVFVCGNTSTSSGLTVTMTRESGGEYSLEAGALILADQGCCCIDEFDKMPTQHAALLEAMEQQTVSIAKAGVVSILPARTTILAAANPVGGHYTKAKTVSENLRIDSALLSRFDLVFILRDKPNQLLDSLLSEHVLSLHDGIKQKKISAQSSCSDVSIASDEYVPLQENLKLFKDEEVDVLPHQLLRKYIAYARKYVHPSLSPEAANVLKKFYLELRKRHLTSDGTPVTTRQSQSLTRLTLARAKVELREIATEKDALDVVEIVKYSLVDTFSDEYDKLDFKRLQNGSGMSQRNKVKVFVSVLQRIAEAESRSEFTITELRQAAQNGGVGDDFYNLLNTLNLHGYLLKKDSNIYKLLSVD